MDGQCIGKGLRMIQVHVLHLDDTIHTFQISGHSLGEELFATVVDRFRLLEADYFDLEYVNDEGLRCWLDHNKTILRQYSTNRDFIYRFSVKFYTPHPNLLEEAYTRYLFALQIKRDLVTGTLLCSENTAALLASYIVQAEIGDFIQEEYRTISYLKSLKLLHEPNDERLRRVREFHKSHVGLTPTEADFALLDTARKIEFYGVRLHFARDHEGLALNLAVTHLGLLIFQNLIKVNTFSWAKIRKLSFKRKRFFVKLHPENYDTIEFIFDSRDECKQFWKKSIEHHTFFRCTYPDRKLQRRSRLTSSGSSFRYLGRTEQELQEYVQRNCEKRPPFERPSAARHTSLSKTTAPAYSTRRLNSASLTLRSSSADRRNFMSGTMGGSFAGTLAAQPALKRAQSMGVNAISRDQQAAERSSTDIHLPITTLATSGYATMSGSVNDSGRSSHPKNIEDLEEKEVKNLQSSSQNESGRRMTGDWSGENQSTQSDEGISSRAWKSEAGSLGQNAVTSLSQLNLRMDAFLNSQDDHISLSDQRKHEESKDTGESSDNIQLSKKSTQIVDILQDSSIRGYLLSSSPSFDQGSEQLPDLSSFKSSEHRQNEYSTSRSFNLNHTSISDSDNHPSWSLSLASKILSSQPESIHCFEFSQPPPKPHRTSQILTTREEDSLRSTSKFKRNTIMEPSLGEIIQLHMNRSNLINPITSSATQLIETPVTVQNISNDENIKDDNTYGSNNTATNLPSSQPYEATLILPTVTQLGLEINLDKELSFLHTSSILSSETNNVTDSKTSVTDIVPTIETTSFTHENNTATTMTLSMLPNLSIRSQTISSSITIPPFTTSFSLMTSSLSTTTTATASVAYPESTATTKGSQSLLVSDQLLSSDHSILYDFLPQEDTFSITLNDISILRSSETTDRASTDRQLPKSEVESNRVQLTDFLQTFGLTSSSNEPIDLVKSLVKSNENETYGSLFLDDLGSKFQKFLDTSTTQTAVCTISTASTTTSTSPAKAKSHVTTTLSEISKTHDSLFSHFNANVSRFSVGAEPIHIASLDQWSSSSSESTTGVIIRSDLIPNTSATCHHSVPCINSINPMLQHSLTCPNASKSIPFEQVTNYLHPSEGDVRSSNYKPEHKQVNSGKGITSHSNIPAKSKHYKHLQSHEHVCSHDRHLSSSIPSGIHLTELEESILSTSQHVHNMMPTENVKRIHGKHSDGKKFEQVRRNKHLHHLHEQMNQESSGNHNLVSLNDLENAAEILEEVPYVVLRRPRSVDVKQYQLHLEHQRQQAAALAAAAGGYPFHLYQTPGAHYPFTSRLPIGSQLSYGHYVQPPPFHGFRSLECNQNHHLDAPITFGSHRKSEQSGKQASHKFSSSHSKQVSKRDSDSCKRHSKRTHSRSRKETEPFAFDEKSDKKLSHYDVTTNHITATNLPPQTTSSYPHHRHHDHCLHRRSEVLSSGKTNGVSGDRKVKSSTLASTVTTISTATNVSSKDKKYDKSNIEHDDLARGRETIIPSVLSSVVVTTTTSATGLTKQKSQLPELQQLQPSSPMQEKKTKATTSMMTIESQKLKQISPPDGREENGESEIPYPVSVSAVKPVPKLKATSKSTSRRQTHEHLQHPILPPYWHYHHNEAQPQQYHQHHPACASLIGKHDATTRSTKDQPQPTIYGSEFLATNYPHIFTKVLKPSGSGKSEPRITSTKKKVTSKPSGLSGDQMKPAVMYDFTENNKESDEKISKQTKKSSSKPYSDELFRGDMDPNETFEKLREDLRSAGFTVDTNRPYLSTTKSKNNKQPTDGYVQEPKKVGDKTHSQSKPKPTDITNDRVILPNYSRLITSSTTSTTTTTSTTVAAGSVPSESTKSNAVEEIELATSTGKVNISNLIPTYDSMSGLHPRTPIYLDSESEEEMITNVRSMSVEETVQVPDTKDSQICKKQVEEWIEKSQAVYNAEEVSKDTDTQPLRKEDKQHTEINSAVDLGHEHNVEIKSRMASERSQTDLIQRSPRSHSPSLPLSCHSIEPGSTDLSFSSNSSTSASSYSMLSGYDYTPSAGCSCERVHRHGYYDYSLSSFTSSSCEYPRYTHRSHHSRPSSFHKQHGYYRHQTCYCHRCISRSRDSHHKRHASEHQYQRHTLHKHPERHRSHHSDHHRYHSHSHHSSGKRSSLYYPHHHRHHHHNHKSEKDRKHDHSDELSDDKSTTSSSKSLEKISLDENDLLKSNLEYSPTMISADKLSDVKNSQKELLSNLKLQKRKLKQELAKHRALTEKLVKVKRFNEKLLTTGKVSLSNPILNLTKSKENNVACDPTEREDDNFAENIYNKDSIDVVHSKITSSELNDEVVLPNEQNKDELRKSHRRLHHHKTLSRSSSHKLSKSRSDHSSASRRRLRTTKKHDREQSTDVQGTTQEPHIKSSLTIETDINKESTETMGDRLESKCLESSSSHKRKERKDVQHREGQKHRSKYEANYKHHHDHRRHKHSGNYESNETTTGNQKTTKELDEMPKSEQLEIDQSSLSTSYKEDEPSITDNLLIITNKAAIEYQNGEQSLICEQSDITKLSTPITTASSTLIMSESAQQIHQSTYSTPSHSIEPNIVKCHLEVISEKQDNDQSSSSQHLSNDEVKQLAIKNQSPSVYENLNISENKHIEESQSTQLTGDKTDELPPIPPTCPPPIDYTLSHVTDRTDESADLMVKQAIELLDEVVAKSTQIEDNGQGRLLSSVNKCLEYSSSEQVMLDDDKEFNGTRIPNILDNNENLFDTVATADNSAYGDRMMQIVGETNENDVSNRPYSPCESTTSASEGSEDIEPFPPPPSAEVLAEVIEEETGPNIEVVEEEEEEEENDEDDDCEENRRKSSSVSTVIEVSLPITASVSTTQTFDDNETTKNKPKFSNEEIRDDPFIEDEPKEDDTAISESVKTTMDAEPSIVLSAQTNQTTDCEKLTTEESSSTNKNLEFNSPSE
ncbi:unnamed protein product [Schistosoma rodhaini]|uniref:FERM domain-containing protein n=2 Tax=Schistosoma rodhaini TaxID=6188 RepID=A0AA85EMM9_9TREM|nr:unnamed protein product [Schistosoma rodhaini]